MEAAVFCQRLQRLQVFGELVPGLSLRSNPKLELANAFGVHYFKVSPLRKPQFSCHFFAD
jgi:hypothetical protein